MRLVIQRVSSASVEVDGEPVAAIGAGFLVLVGVGRDDRDDDTERLAEKVVHLRVFADEAGKMNRSLLDVAGEALVISQFTLYGDLRKGRRPSFADAAEPEIAASRVEALAAALEARGVAVGRGVFGAHMRIELVNDGPVTLVLDAAIA
ncbi:MAG: D-aminoacyl-tRNA deacylase [Actinomycetota bacterium]